MTFLIVDVIVLDRLLVLTSLGSSARLTIKGAPNFTKDQSTDGEAFRIGLYEESQSFSIGFNEETVF